EKIKKDLGPFPFINFWGPGAGIACSKWIAESAKWVEDKYWPSLNLVYLPHLDYGMQKFGPEAEEMNQELADIDAVVGDLIDFFEKRNVKVILLSEYGITEVDHPVHLNRIFREKGWITIKDELGREILDLGASKAFAIADHQVAHVYVNESGLIPEVVKTLERTEGVESVLHGDGLRGAGIDHERAGDIVAVSDARSWFTYYYWEDDRVAPDFARCVDIHRKPGYDPVELFVDPRIPLPKLKIATKLAKKALGFRMLMDVIPLDATLVRGSHGRTPEDREDWPVIAGDLPELPKDGALPPEDVFEQLFAHCAGGSGYGDLAK
ncbi:MAG: nucleotide pyrophosphatase/phosphodiesterase family protein, partial [Verrucomicrobiota bacterium]